MKIAVNARLLLQNKLEGIGWFTFEVFNRIVKAHPEHTFYFIFDRPYSKEFVLADNVIPVESGPPSRHPVLWFLYFHVMLPLKLRKIKPELFISPEGYIPLTGRFRRLNTMHDIAFEYFPQSVPKLALKYYRYFFPRYCKKADLVVTVSDFSKSDLIRTYNVRPDKIRVVFNGCNPAFKPVPSEQQVATRDHWTSGKSYFVFIGGLYPRKNLRNLILAFEKFRQSYRSDIKLVIIGQKISWYRELNKIIKESSVTNDIIFTGRLDDMHQVVNLIGSSHAMTYVSKYEGFGIPCLEAMQAGVPVITSENSSMSEICGDAAIYVDPFSPDSISKAMTTVTSNPELRLNLSEKGINRSKQYSWDRTANLFWKSVEELIVIKNESKK